jgi:S1-C subfamily serine protease
MRRQILVLALLLAVVGLVQAGENERGFLGVTLATVNNVGVGEDDNGVYINEVLPGTGAEASGLAEHDRILAIDGNPVANVHDIHQALGAAGADTAVTVSVKRDGVEQDITVVLGRAPAARDKRFGVVVDREGPFLGIQLQNLNPQLAEYFGVDRGVLITEVVEDTAAERAGFQAGDVVLEFGDHPIRNPHELHEVLEAFEVGQEVAVGVQRRGAPTTLYVELEEMPPEKLHRIMEKMEQFHLQHLHEGNVEIVVPSIELKGHDADIHERHHHDEDKDN